MACSAADLPKDLLRVEHGAGGMGDMFVVTPDGAGDVPATKAFQRSLSALLRATRTFP